MTLKAPRRQSLRVPGFDYADPRHVFFVTIGARRGETKAPFADERLSKVVVESLSYLRDTRGVRIYCYCLMPDHLHLLISPSERSGSLIQVVHSFKSYTTKASWSFGLSGSLWSRSFYDRMVRHEEDLRVISEYILGNPVRAGLAEDPNDYPFQALLDPFPE